MSEKRPVKVTVGVHLISARASWRSAALIIEDRTGDKAPRTVTVKIESPSDLSYIRERLDDIEAAWRKELQHWCPAKPGTEPK